MPFDTAILDRALADQQQQNETERRSLLRQTLATLDALGPQFGIERAYIFGSLLQPGRFHADSDVDIAVETIDPDQHFTAISQLMSALGRDVDLIRLDSCHFAPRIRERGLLWTQTYSLS
jgi:predicted nucleotidyltransferase